MSGTAMVVAIVFISVGFGVMYDMYKKHLEFKERTQNHSSRSDEQAIAMRKQIQTLEERIQVLEKIVTDEGYNVQKEINNL
jgi:type II secretory pathway component PulJ